MADQVLEDLTENTAPLTTDILYLVDDPAGSPLGQKITLANLLGGIAGDVVINEGSGDYDFRVESNGNANMIFVDAGNDRVGIGDSTPSVTLDVAGTISWIGDGTVPCFLTQGAGNNCQMNVNVNASNAVQDSSKAQWKLVLGETADYVRFSHSPVGATYTETTVFEVSGTGNIVPTKAALATNATDGFIYIPSCAGTPTGTPTAYTGTCAIVWDSTNNKLYVYDGGWVDTT